MPRPLHIFAKRALPTTVLACVLAVGLVVPQRVLADSSGRKNPQSQARVLFRESQDLEKAGDLRGALGKLEEAYTVLPTPTLLWPIATLHLTLNEPVEALDALRRYRQEMAPAEMEPGQQLPDVEKLEERARGQLGYLRPAAPAGTRIVVDGKEVGAAPLPERLPVNPGRHTIAAAGARPGSEIAVEVTPGQEVEAPLGSSEPARRDYFPSPFTWAAIGVTTAALFATTVVGGLALSDTRYLDGLCVDRLCAAGGNNPDIATLNSAVSAQRTHGAVAGTLIAVTGLLMIGTTVLIVIDRQRQKAGRKLFSATTPGSGSGRLSLLPPAPFVARDGAGLALGGRF